ncbi:MAG: transposase [Nitrospinae bacterium]|nr:transposase [Nitrospinota bacterium]
MARPLRIEYPGAVYHVTSRGNARENIYLEDEDYTVFLVCLCDTIERFNWILHAYCLMGNHYHLLIETPEGNLSRGMRHLNGIYTQKFNRKHKRVGHIFQGRYKAILVDKDSYLKELCRYIVLNPVKATMVKEPKEWLWSSYNSTAGYCQGIPCLTNDWILLQFGRDREKAEKEYREFVAEGIVGESPWSEVRGQLYLGDDKFLDGIKQFIKDRETLKEIPRTQRYITKSPLKDIFENNKENDKATFEAHIRFGYTLKEVADYLGVHYSTISRAVRRIDNEKRK